MLTDTALQKAVDLSFPRWTDPDPGNTPRELVRVANLTLRGWKPDYERTGRDGNHRPHSTLRLFVHERVGSQLSLLLEELSKIIGRERRISHCSDFPRSNGDDLLPIHLTSHDPLHSFWSRCRQSSIPVIWSGGIPRQRRTSSSIIVQQLLSARPSLRDFWTTRPLSCQSCESFDSRFNFPSL